MAGLQWVTRPRRVGAEASRDARALAQVPPFTPPAGNDQASAEPDHVVLQALLIESSPRRARCVIGAIPTFVVGGLRSGGLGRFVTNRNARPSRRPESGAVALSESNPLCGLNAPSVAGRVAK